MGKIAIIGDRPPSFLSKATLAAEFDISESTVDEWVRRGIFPQPVRLGGSVRWRWAEVSASIKPVVAVDEDPFMKGLGNVKD
jgi:predicted DNA-binding transcriptional regulator AlpA